MDCMFGFVKNMIFFGNIFGMFFIVVVMMRYLYDVVSRTAM